MSQSVRTSPDGSARALSEAYDTALLDLDGVVYAGGNAIAHAVDSLATARAGGMRLAYVTNNALRTPDAVAEHLTELGIPTEGRRRHHLRAGRRPADQRAGAGGLPGAGDRRGGAAGRAARART
jgi:hypothetical protein